MNLAGRTNTLHIMIMWFDFVEEVKSMFAEGGGVFLLVAHFFLVGFSVEGILF